MPQSLVLLPAFHPLALALSTVHASSVLASQKQRSPADRPQVHSPAAPASLRASAAKSEGSPSGGAAAVRASSQHPLRASLVGLQQALASNIATNASTPVPTPLAVAGSMVLGALLYLLRRPPAEGGVWDRPGRKQLGHSYRKNYGADYWRSAERLRAQRK